MTARVQPPICNTCGRRHWEIVATEMAARHCHMNSKRFRRVIKSGHGPAPSLAEVYAFPRYHVAELDRWLATITQIEVAA